MEDINNLVAFKSISNFIKDLFEVFGEKNRPVALYNRMIEKTTIAHDKVIAKHVECFASFCTSNREAIAEKAVDKLSKPYISYSKNVSLDMGGIIRTSDPDTQEAIWNHLLAISAIVDPASNAKQILRQSIAKRADGSVGGEEEFLTSMIDKVEKTIDPSAMQNPMHAIGSLLTSGVFTDMIGSMQKGINDGSLDLGRLMGTMQTVMGGMGGGGAAGSGMPPIDLGAITGLLGGMLPKK